MKIKLLSENAIMPTKATEGAAAYDLAIPSDVTIFPGRQRLFLWTLLWRFQQVMRLRLSREVDFQQRVSRILRVKEKKKCGCTCWKN